MSIWGAMSNSVTAMNAQGRALGNISQNIANISTTGYKRTDSNFATVLSEGLGAFDIFSVKNADRTLVESQGTVANTGRWSDVAIRGQGLFAVRTELDGGEILYTRDGSFDVRGIGDEVYLVDGNGYFLQGWAADGSGATGRTTSLSYNPEDLIAGRPTGQLAVAGNVSASATAGDSGVLAASIYDPAGELHALDLTWTRTATPNEWVVTFAANGGTSPTSVTAAFDAAGKLVTPTSAAVTMAWADGSSSAFNLDLSQMTQLGDDIALVDYTQDGYTPGRLTEINVNANGEIVGSYSNGVGRTLGQVALATFVSPNNLEQRSGNLFAATAAAGDVEYRSVGEDWSGSSFVSSALEASNVDLAGEFTRMIMTQKAYTSASKVFQTADEMTKTAGGMKA